MKVDYAFNLSQQILSGAVSAAVAVLVTYVFDHEIKWALAITIGIATFITTGFYKR